MTQPVSGLSEISVRKKSRCPRNRFFSVVATIFNGSGEKPSESVNRENPRSNFEDVLRWNEARGPFLSDVYHQNLQIRKFSP